MLTYDLPPVLAAPNSSTEIDIVLDNLNRVPTLAASIATIYDLRINDSNAREGDTEGVTPWVSAELLAQCPNLRALDVWVFWRSINVSPLGHLVEQLMSRQLKLSALRSLSLWFTTPFGPAQNLDMGVGDMMSLLQAMPSLLELEIEGPRLLGTVPKTTALALPSVELLTLHCPSRNFNPLLAAFVDNLKRGSLVWRTVQDVEEEQSPRTLRGSVHRALQTLKIAKTNACEVLQPWPGVLSSSVTQLLLTDLRRYRSSYNQTAKLLSSCTNLKTFLVEVHPYHDIFQWNLRDLLEVKQLAQLRSLWIHFTGSGIYHEVWASIMQLLARFVGAQRKRKLRLRELNIICSHEAAYLDKNLVARCRQQRIAFSFQTHGRGTGPHLPRISQV